MAKTRNDTNSPCRNRLFHWLAHYDDALDIAMQEEYDENAAASDTVTDADVVKHTSRRSSHSLNSHDLIYKILSVVVCGAIITFLLMTAMKLPDFGNAADPANNEVSTRYIEKGMEETGAVNIVAGMILDYRAFDTLGESNVLFIAACTVMILLRIGKGDPAGSLKDEANDRMMEPKHDLILQKIATVLVPVILLFGMYVIMNGHLSPGGGFSGGAVMGAGLILYLSAFGFQQTERFFTFKTFRIVSVSALSFYAVSKTYSFFTGANHLWSFITPGTPGKLFSAGLIPYLNLAVGLVVCCTMYALYTLFRKGDM